MKRCQKLVKKDKIVLVFCVSLLLGTVIFVKTRLFKPENWEFSYDIIIEPGVSDSWTSGKSVLVCVSSAAGNREKRDAIRKTWGSHSSLRVVFFFGFDFGRQARIIEEAQKNADIVQYNFKDTYRNLTLKTVSMIDWAHHNRWPQRTHVFKIDDDTFLNTKVLDKHIDGFDEPAIYGSLFEDLKPVRDPHSQYFLSWNEYHPTKFPTYLSGALYMIHESALAAMYAHMCLLRPIPIEDVYITGLVANLAQVRKIGFPQTARLLDVPEYNEDYMSAWFYGEANLDLSNVLGVHYAEPDMQHAYWRQLQGLPRQAQASGSTY